jgi:small subunit ribosomal protein S17
MKTEANDKNQPDLGSLSLRGRVFKGVVINDTMQQTVTVEWERRKPVKKYERYEKKRTRVKAHNPESINAKKGDIVEIQECRPLSKTKHFVVIKKMGEERLFAEREKSLEEAKVKKKPKEKVEEEAPKQEAPEEKVEETVEEVTNEGS